MLFGKHFLVKSVTNLTKFKKNQLAIQSAPSNIFSAESTFKGNLFYSLVCFITCRLNIISKSSYAQNAAAIGNNLVINQLSASVENNRVFRNVG